MSIKFACACQVGSGHRNQGLPCQDSAEGFASDTASCIVLADGAGSHSDSHFAAQAVTFALSRCVAQEFSRLYSLPDTELRRYLLEQARCAASKVNVVPNCTLLLFAADETGRCLLAHLGDGAILGACSNHENILLSAPENGEEKNITFFVSGSCAEEHLRIQRVLPPDCRAVLLCSDGSACALMNELNGQVAPAVSVLANMVAAKPQPEAETCMREDLDVLFRAHTPDDMSLALLCFSASAPSESPATQASVVPSSEQAPSEP